MNTNLTNTTEEIMNYLWEHEDGLTFRQIYDYFTLTQNKTWKRQTLYTHITILMEKGFIRAEGTRRKMIYIPAVTLDTYRKYYAENVLNARYDGSLSKFVSAFTDHHTLTQEEADELLELINRKEK